MLDCLENGQVEPEIQMEVITQWRENLWRAVGLRIQLTDENKIGKQMMVDKRETKQMTNCSGKSIDECRSK